MKGHLRIVQKIRIPRKGRQETDKEVVQMIGHGVRMKKVEGNAEV